MHYRCMSLSPFLFHLYSCFRDLDFIPIVAAHNILPENLSFHYITLAILCWQSPVTLSSSSHPRVLIRHSSSSLCLLPSRLFQLIQAFFYFPSQLTHELHFGSRHFVIQKPRLLADDVFRCRRKFIYSLCRNVSRVILESISSSRVT